MTNNIYITAIDVCNIYEIKHLNFIYLFLIFLIDMRYTCKIAGM